MEQFLNYNLYGNMGKDYVIALGIFIIAYIALNILQKVLITRFRKLAKFSKTEVDDVIIDIIANLKPPFYLIVAIYISVRAITLPDQIWQIIHIVFLSVLVYEGIQAAQKITTFLVYKALKKDGEEEQAKTTVKTFNVFIKIALWSIGLLLVLSNAGVNVSSLLAGLGIGGIAIALALQNILGDVFSSFSILIDKPFQVGDFIKIGTDLGVVEKIGIKTTRLRTLDGQILIVANRELTTTRVENFRQIKKRRSLFTLGVVYESKAEDLEKIPVLIKELVEKQDLAEFDRCHFKSFGDFSLNFEVSYFVAADSYVEFLDVVEKINLAIFKSFKNASIEFAYPTALHYQKNI